jgi:hypothetical protein
MAVKKFSLETQYLLDVTNVILVEIEMLSKNDNISDFLGVVAKIYPSRNSSSLLKAQFISK